jgi:hypothetical protein
LSVFLAGDLEKPLSSVTPELSTPSPQSAAPASWRTPVNPTKQSSLLDIQFEEAAASAASGANTPGSRGSSRSRLPSSTPSSLQSKSDPAFRVSMADLVAAKRSAPIPLKKEMVRGSSGGGAWGAAAGCSPPVTTQQSLRLIQAEQHEDQVLGKSWGKSSQTSVPVLAHWSSWRERKSTVTAAGGSPGMAMHVLGSSPGIMHRSPAV